MESIALSLVSHTNVGKTTLARTLMRRDVGSVFDQAHVTDVSESWTLLETEGARLQLWDTPGFGDTARLLRRLRNERNPLGWFLHEVWDKVTDRALWCGQEAVRNIREDADVVIYLVSAAEDPEDAAYVPLELELVGWLEKPVLLLLNQTGDADDATQLEARWRAAVADWSCVKDVLSLDAFTRCWVQEGALLERVAGLLPSDKQGAMSGLVAAWDARNLATFGASTAALGGLLAGTAVDREGLPSVMASKGDKRRAMDALADRLDQRSKALMEGLIEGHGLDGEAAAQVRERVDDFIVPADSPFDVRRSALVGGLVTGAATGVTAEVMTGGLGLGSGIVVGAALGALGGAGLAKGYEFVLGFGKEPAVRWGGDFLTEQTRQVCLRYLAVAQFGRGRGAFHDDVLPATATAAATTPEGDADAATRSSEPANPWLPLVDEALKAHASELAGCWKAAAGGEDQEPALTRLVTELLRSVLLARYPGAGRLLVGDMHDLGGERRHPPGVPEIPDSRAPDHG